MFRRRRTRMRPSCPRLLWNSVCRAGILFSAKAKGIENSFDHCCAFRAYCLFLFLLILKSNQITRISQKHPRHDEISTATTKDSLVLYGILCYTNSIMSETIPKYFESVLWSHDISAIDPEQSPNLLITQAINYGDLRHWRWIVERYGAEAIKRIITSLPTTALRPGARALAEVVFSIPSTHGTITSRGSHA